MGIPEDRADPEHGAAAGDLASHETPAAPIAPASPGPDAPASPGPDAPASPGPDAPASPEATPAGEPAIYPLSLRLTGRRVVVVGGGSVALRRVAGLRAVGADILLVSPQLSPTLDDLATRGLITARRRGYEPADLDGAWLVLACTDQPGVNAAVAADAERQRIWCARADDAAASAAWVPAVGRSGAVTVAVNAGRNPRRAAVLRDRLVETVETDGRSAEKRGELPGGGGRRAGAGAEQGQAPSGGARESRGWEQQSAGAGKTERGGGESGARGRGKQSGAGREARGREKQSGGGREARGREKQSAGRVSIVGGGPGDPGLITVTGLRRLREADVVVADRLAPLELLEQVPPGAHVIDGAKVPGRQAMRQDHINQALVEHARAGRAVVRLKGGDPFVFGRGREEVEACLTAGVPVGVVPGVTSAISVPAAAGVPVTHRGLARGFACWPGMSARVTRAARSNWAALARSRG